MARRKKKGEESHCETAGGLRWLITYADMITLLLGVFIILVSNSAIGESKYKAMKIAFSKVFSLFTGTQEGETLPSHLGGIFPAKSGAQVDFPETKNVRTPVAREYKDEITTEKIKTLQTRKGMLFRLSDIMFDENSSKLNPKYSHLLNKIGHFIEGIPNEIRIEGHTDAKPMKGAFSSNWELSIERANAVRRYLFGEAEKRLSGERLEMYKKRFSIVGFGETNPIVSDIYSPLNRRVDIVIIESSKSEVKRRIFGE